MQGNLRLAIDVGGTFTDVVLEHGGRIDCCKVLTTPHAPERGIMTGIAQILRQSARRLEEVDVFIHGTTLATNALIERKGAKTILLTTAGFEDCIEIATESRYDQYELALIRPEPLAQRNLRVGVRERMSGQGRPLIRLNADEMDRLSRVVAESGAQSVAISLLHSYLNPHHEQLLRDFLCSRHPSLTISISSEVCPEIREYERTSTTLVNAYVSPLIDSYLARLETSLAEAGFRGAFWMIASSGGLTSVDVARRFPVRLLESGPAGGALFASDIARRETATKAMAFDMGGTTAKICLINEYETDSARLFEADRAARFMKGSGIPIRIPVVELVEIGAGGGSIARVDALDRITVGPDSAASDPGPVCFCLGGSEPTVTDANVILGLINIADFAGGSINIDTTAALEAFDRIIGKRLNLEAHHAAAGTYETVSDNMAAAARVHAIEMGHNPGDFTLIATGGGGPLHGARIAEILGIKKVIIPANASVGSAIGFLAAPVSFEMVRSRLEQLDRVDPAATEALFAEMRLQIEGWMAESPDSEGLCAQRSAYMRYVGQGHDIAVPLPEGALDLNSLIRAFENNYLRQFNRLVPNGQIEVVAWALRLTKESRTPEPLSQANESRRAVPAAEGRYYSISEGSFQPIAIYHRAFLRAGDQFDGPALVYEAGTTTFVTSSFRASVSANGAILLNHNAT